jgi:predicted nucleotidyltransferase
MNSLETLLQRISLVLSKQKQAWALVGGLAVSVRTEPRFTRDLDLAVAVSSDREAEALVHSLLGEGFQTFATVEHEESKRLATARIAPFGSSPQGLVLDMLFASSGIETDICMAAESLLVFPKLAVPVARMYHLIALKVLSRDDRTRPQDVADLRQLIAAADPSDLALACDAARLIERRGFNRERDLVAALNEVWNEFRS